MYSFLLTYRCAAPRNESGNIYDVQDKEQGLSYNSVGGCVYSFLLTYRCAAPRNEIVNVYDVQTLFYLIRYSKERVEHQRNQNNQQTADYIIPEKGDAGKEITVKYSQLSN